MMIKCFTCNNSFEVDERGIYKDNPNYMIYPYLFEEQTGKDLCLECIKKQ